MLVLKNIVKHYTAGDTVVEALRGVDLAFRESEFVSVLGPSGCGKTTLLNIIGGLDRYTSGDLVINGRSTKEYRDADWDAYRNRSIGFIFQSYNLIPHQTVLANVELALTLSGVSKAERRRRAREALEQVGLGDQLAKRPNQLSGGQMQRVAVARALVNNPDILLADEPTGALDSETSVQLMEILKGIAADRLVIMVTHNPDLAERYSTRIVRVLDGQVLSDSDPYTPTEADSAAPAAKQRQKKSPMGFLTALGLSTNNLLTKKARTLLTAFAGSIGIIGIALILSLSNGVQNYIDRVQEDTLSSYPITIEATAMDYSSLLTSLGSIRSGQANHELDGVYSNSVMYELMDVMMNSTLTTNDLAAFKEYIESEDNPLGEGLSAVRYSYRADYDIYAYDPDGKAVNTDGSGLFGSFGSFGAMSRAYMNVWDELMPPGEGETGLVSDTVLGQYDLLYGRWPQAWNEVVLVLSENNEISDLTLYALGIKSSQEFYDIMGQIRRGEEIDTSPVFWSYEEICQKKFYLTTSADGASRNPDGTWKLPEDDAEVRAALGEELTIVGVLRPAEGGAASSVSGSVGYTTALTNHVITSVADSAVVQAMEDTPDTDIFSGLPYEPTDTQKAALAKERVPGLGISEKASLMADLLRKEGAAEEADEDALPDRDAMVAAVAKAMEIDEKAAAAMTAAYSDEALYAMLQSYGLEVEAGARAISGYTETELADLLTERIAAMTDEELVFLYDAALAPKTATWEENRKTLGVVDVNSPESIRLYAQTFAGKEEIAAAIRKYNDSVDKAQRITYTDYVALLMSSVTTVLNAISYVLVAFVSISLVVSSIMIGIITYISVLERTKEIGILRSIGASKRDVARVFNAEALILGFCAGVMGIGLTILIDIPVSLIVRALTGIPYLTASLPTGAAIVLVIISMGLTLIAGLIPSRIAARKDPVVALRTE